MPLLRLCRRGEINLCLSLANMSCQICEQSWSKPWTNFSRQDEPWAEFSTLEVAACHAMHLPYRITMRPNLELKTQPKQLLGSLPLDIALPEQTLRQAPCLTSQYKTSFKVLPTNAIAYLTSSESDRKMFDDWNLGSAEGSNGPFATFPSYLR
jgi:hypothetical protein